MKLRLTERTLDRVALPASKPQLLVWDKELPGFGVVIGRKSSTFVANYWAKGVKRRQVIGRRGAIGDDGQQLNVSVARQRAREILGRVAGGADPSLELRMREGGPTLADAFDLHVARMKANGASAASLATITRERDKYLENWLARPLRTIERSHCRELHEALSKKHGPYLANRVMRHVRAAWNTSAQGARPSSEPDHRGALEQGAPPPGADSLGAASRLARDRRLTRTDHRQRQAHRHPPGHPW